VDQYLNWVTLIGVGLIATGVALLAVALNAAKDFAPARHRRGTGQWSPRRQRTETAQNAERVPVGRLPRASRPPR
jgi:hypothetical protein